ncbi:hypothetical protein IWW52_005169 [Coemansia sp. RSA 2704]|nr:hypothetical protein IWW52_005169 [Coemansia sp. RSA 2704]
MADGQTWVTDVNESIQPLTQQELALIRQLRALQLKREQHVRQPGRPEPLGMIMYDDRKFLEINPAYTPIMVPVHMKEEARQCLSQHFRQLAQERARALQTPRSPPPTPQFPAQQQVHYGPQAPYLPGPPSPPYTANTGYSHPPSNYAVAAPGTNLPYGSDAGDTTFGLLPAAQQNGMYQTPLSPSEPLSPPYMTSVPEDEIDAAPLASDNSSSTKQEASTPKPESQPSKTCKLSRGRRSPSAALDCISTGNLNSTPACDNQSDDENNEQPSHCSDDNNSDDGNVKDEEPEADEEQLRKPPNAFILYRKDKNQALRREQPGISVESASAIIGKWWREEEPANKAKYKQQAAEEREKYFAKKKKLQARLKRKKAEREGSSGAQQQRASASLKTKRDPANEDMVREIIFPRSHTLSSLSPGALSHPPLSTSMSGVLAPMLPRPPRHVRSLTLGADVPLPGSLALDGSGLVGSHMTSSALSTPMDAFSGDLGIDVSRAQPYLGIGASVTAEIDRQVATSLEQLSAQLSQPLQTLPMSSMALDMPATTAAALQSLTAMSTGDSSAAEWTTGQPAVPGEFDGMFNSLFHSGN